MTESVSEFIELYLPQIVGTGSAIGFAISFFVILLGYMVGRIQSLLENLH